ncbi:hypothetical protein Taro_010203, partial [Colocasia esculenta]|nr:hypothetical protein [Colocasia esculenta]
ERPREFARFFQSRSSQPSPQASRKASLVDGRNGARRSASGRRADDGGCTVKVSPSATATTRSSRIFDRSSRSPAALSPHSGLISHLRAWWLVGSGCIARRSGLRRAAAPFLSSIGSPGRRRRCELWFPARLSDIRRSHGGITASESNPNEREREEKQMENEEGEEEEECGFCLFMKGGPCKEEFIAWEKCVEAAEKNEENMVDKCFEVTGLLRKCMEAHTDYYEPILRAEKAMEEEAARELGREQETDTGLSETKTDTQENK